MTYRIITYSPKNPIPAHSFFILSKGLNSGKPLLTPCANSFVVSAKDESTREFLYWLLYSLWKSRAYYQFHVGSVIPFIRIHEFRKFVQEKYAEARAKDEEHEKTIRALRTLEDKEKQYMQNIALLQDAKRVILARYLRK
jgi:hypothetical protein